jgi:hypothetical protein
MSSQIFDGMIFVGLLFVSVGSLIDLSIRIYSKLTPSPNKPVNLLDLYSLISVIDIVVGAVLFVLGSSFSILEAFITVYHLVN